MTALPSPTGDGVVGPTDDDVVEVMLVTARCRC
jgi:hypothetical protein